MPEKQGAFPAALCGALTARTENYGTICSICCALILLGMCVLFTVFGLLVYYPARKLNAAIAGK